MDATRRPVTRSDKEPESSSSSKGIRLIVRKGATERFEALQRKTEKLQVEVTWDRREGDRRREPAQPGQERRSGDRRQGQPFTWDTADFAVVVDSE